MDTVFLDAAYPGTAAQFIAALKTTNASGFAFYIGGNNALHDWDKAVVDAILAAGYEGIAVYVPALNHSGAADGQDAVNAAHAYGLPASFKICVDIEPSNFNRAGIAFSKTYSNEWCDAVRSARYSPGPYGTATTVADCADHADYIWIADPGQPDPMRVGLTPSAVGVQLSSTFFAGKRMIQFGSGNIGGVSYDINHSQVALSSLNNTGEEDMAGVGFTDQAEHDWVIKTLQQLAVELLQSPEGDGVRAKFSTLGAAVLDIKAKVDADLK